MPLHDVGYRSWEGAKSKLSFRWLVIATTGIRLAFRSTWLSRTLVLAWVPAIIVGVWFFLYEQSIVQPQFRQVIGGIVATSGASPEVMAMLARDPENARHDVWSSLLLVFFRYPQSVLMLIVVGIVAPRLISYDLRNRGYLLYFSRPVQMAGYIGGKGLVICAFLGLITTLPAIALYLVGLSLSPDATVITATWDIPLRILAASVVLMVPVASVALACSALTIESRYAVFAWFAIWIMGWVSYSVLRVGEMAASNLPAENGEGIPTVFLQSQWEVVSPFHVLGRVQQYIFGLFPEDRSVIPYAMMLITVTVVSLWFVSSRIRARLRA